MSFIYSRDRIKSVLSQIFKLLPASLFEYLGKLPSSSGAYHLARLGVKNRTVTIGNGIGAGLKFNAGQSNPDYALGINEFPVQQALAGYLKPGDVFYDIGANVGFFSAIAARLVGSSGHVYAFEPVPENVVQIRHNAKCNNFANVTVLEKAVSRSTGKAELLLAHYSGGSTLSVADRPPDLKGTTTVDTIAIDDLVAESAIAPPTVVKIDVEGAEMDALQGMTQTIQDFQPIIIYEVDASDREAIARKTRTLDAFIQSLGYAIKPLENSYDLPSWAVGHTLAYPVRVKK
jgi:FkbM family methyltransferase